MRSDLLRKEKQRLPSLLQTTHLISLGHRSDIYYGVGGRFLGRLKVSTFHLCHF